MKSLLRRTPRWSVWLRSCRIGSVRWSVACQRIRRPPRAHHRRMRRGTEASEETFVADRIGTQAWQATGRALGLAQPGGWPRWHDGHL